MQLYNPSTNSWYEYTDPEQTTAQTFDPNTGEAVMTPTTTPASMVQTQGGAPPPGGSMLVAPNGNAQQMAASVLANQFTNWEQVFKPVEQNLLAQSSLNNPAVLTNAVNQASTTAEQSYASMEGVQRRKLSSLGVAPNSQEAAVSNRISSLSKAAGVAGAENQARSQIAYQDQLIALGSAPSPNIVKGGLTPVQ